MTEKRTGEKDRRKGQERRTGEKDRRKGQERSQVTRKRFDNLQERAIEIKEQFKYGTL